MEPWVMIAMGGGAFVLLIIFLCAIYRVADIDKALIITGGKKPKIVVDTKASALRKIPSALCREITVSLET